MSARSYDADPRIAQARAADFVELAARLGAKLKPAVGGEWFGPCPACGGVDRFSFNTRKRVFNCRGEAGAAGDTIAMVQHAAGLDFREALNFIVGQGTAAPRYEPASAPAKPADLNPERARIDRARDIWRESIDPRDTIAEVYLNSRRLHLDAGLAGPVLRFHPRCPWRDDGASETIFVPAMIAAMRSIASDEIVAISRRRLTPEGVKLGKPKFMGVAGGAAIKLDADEWVTGGLAIGEGVETCATARQLWLRPVWALGSKGQIAAFPVLGGVEALTILAEPGAEAEVQACGKRWHAAGREVLINHPLVGSDLNEALQQRKLS